MLRFIIVFCFFIISVAAYAESPDCTALKTESDTLLKRSDSIINSYKDEVSVFGFSSKMVLQTSYEDAGEEILRMAGLVKGCNLLADKDRCQIVSKEIISFITQGSVICKSDKEKKCGICN